MGVQCSMAPVSSGGTRPIGLQLRPKCGEAVICVDGQDGHCMESRSVCWIMGGGGREREEGRREGGREGGGGGEKGRGGGGREMCTVNSLFLIFWGIL